MNLRKQYTITRFIHAMNCHGGIMLSLRDCINCDETIIDRVGDFCSEDCEKMYKEIEERENDE